MHSSPRPTRGCGRPLRRRPADTAAQLLITAGTNPHRLHSEAAFAALRGAAPVPASSGKTNQTPTLARRRPRRQQRAAPHRLGAACPVTSRPRTMPGANYSTDTPRWRYCANSNRAIAREDLQTADPPDRRARVRRPAPGPASQEHHRHRRCSSTTSASGPPSSPASRTRTTTRATPSPTLGNRHGSSKPLDTNRSIEIARPA